MFDTLNVVFDVTSDRGSSSRWDNRKTIEPNSEQRHEGRVSTLIRKILSIEWLNISNTLLADTGAIFRYIFRRLL